MSKPFQMTASTLPRPLKPRAGSKAKWLCVRQSVTVRRVLGLHISSQNNHRSFGAFVNSRCTKVVYIFNLSFITTILHCTLTPQQVPLLTASSHCCCFLIVFFSACESLLEVAGTPLLQHGVHRRNLEALARSTRTEAAPTEEIRGSYSLKATSSMKCA